MGNNPIQRSGMAMRILALTGVCLGAVAVSQPALAAGDAAGVDSSTTASKPAASADDKNVIIVEAQKREENLQNVPIAITALSTQQVKSAGITSTEDLRVAAPSLDFTTAIGGFGLPRIRGVGATGHDPGVENPVAVYIDGVYYSAQIGILQSLFDTKQVAVLKGPQGTLFGRNATGGLIQVTTLGPTYDFHAKGEVGYGNFNTWNAAGYVSGGLSSTLAVSLSGQYKNQQDGFGKNLFNGDPVGSNENWAGRGKIRWEPSSMTSVLLEGDFNGSNGVEPALINFGRNTIGQDMIPFITGLGGDPNYDIYADTDPLSRARQWGTSLTISQDAGFATLKSITAYRHSKFRTVFDPDGTAKPFVIIDDATDDKQFTQEVNLVSNGDGPFSWVLGGFYMWDKSGNLPYSRVTGIFTYGYNGYSDTIDDTTLNSFAGFFQGTLALDPDTHLTAGIRYTHDSRDLHVQDIEFNGNIPNATPEAGPVYTDSFSTGKPTWRISLDHRFSPDFMMYASYNRGFRSGAYIPNFDPIITLKPELIDAFEVGLKSELADGKIRLNLAGYYYDQSSVQVMQIIAGLQEVYNANGAEIYGVDGDVAIEVTPNFHLTGAFDVTEAHYKSFTDAIISTPYPLPAGFVIPAGQSCLGTFGDPYSAVGGNCLLIGDATGNRLQNTPAFSSSVGANWDIPVSFGTFTLAANWYYNGGYVGTPDERVTQKAYSLVNASLTWHDASDAFYVKVWGRNLTDAFYRRQIGASNSGDNGYSGEPRTYGVTLGFDI